MTKGDEDICLAYGSGGANKTAHTYKPGCQKYVRLKRIKGYNKSWRSMATEGRLSYWMRETREQTA